MSRRMLIHAITRVIYDDDDDDDGDDDDDDDDDRHTDEFDHWRSPDHPVDHSQGQGEQGSQLLLLLLGVQM